MKRQNTTQQKPRLFQLVRHTDVSGVRGTGTLAEGVEWSDGAVTLRWRGRWPVTSLWDGGIDALLAVHGHNGRTQIHWLAITQQTGPRSTALQEIGPHPVPPQEIGLHPVAPQEVGPCPVAPQSTVPVPVDALWLPAAGPDGLCGRCGRGWPCLGCDP